MSKATIGSVQRELNDTREQLKFYQSLVGAFWEGRMPEGTSSLQHNIFASWGRKRLEALKDIPVLLRGGAE